MSSSVEQIIAGKYPAKAHAETVAAYILARHPDVTDGLIYLESAISSFYEDCDQEGTPSRTPYPLPPLTPPLHSPPPSA